MVVGIIHTFYQDGTSDDCENIDLAMEPHKGDFIYFAFDDDSYTMVEVMSVVLHTYIDMNNSPFIAVKAREVCANCYSPDHNEEQGVNC